MKINLSFSYGREYNWPLNIFKTRMKPLQSAWWRHALPADKRLPFNYAIVSSDWHYSRLLLRAAAW